MADPTPEERLATAGLSLPEPPRPVGSYVAGLLDGDLLLVSGQLPLVDGKLPRTGAVGDAVTPDDARRDAGVCAVNGLAVAKATLGALSRVRRVLRVVCYVASTPGFTDHPAVANGASDVMTTAFGDAGRHARAAVGCSSLPRGTPVEVEFMFRVEP